MVSPVLVWNARNGWVSFVYQAQHGAGSVWRLQDVLRFALVQLLAYGPLLCFGALARTSAGALRWFFVLPFAVLAWLSGGGSSLRGRALHRLRAWPWRISGGRGWTAAA